MRLVICDQHSGLVAALGRVFQGVGHQRCRVHFVPNLLALVPMSHKDMVAAVFRTIFAQPDAETVAATWDSVRHQLAAAFHKIGPLMDDAKAEVLAFTGFPRSHWPKIWSTNPVRHEAPVRREALGVEGGARPPRRAVAAAWWELSAVRPGRRWGGREAALTKPGRSGTARRVGFGERDQRAYERNQW